MLHAGPPIQSGVTADVLAVSLQDRWVLGVRRRGKQLWVELTETKGGARVKSVAEGSSAAAPESKVAEKTA